MLLKRQPYRPEWRMYFSLYNKMSGFGVRHVYWCSDAGWAGRKPPASSRNILNQLQKVLTTQRVTQCRQAGAHFCAHNWQAARYLWQPPILNLAHFDSSIKNWNLSYHEHITHDKSRARGKEDNYNNQKAINTAKNDHKVENKESLGLCSARDLGPRGSKDKLFKSKKN